MSNLHAESQVRLAIEESIREDRSVGFEAMLDSQQWVDLAHVLSVDCEDYTEETTEEGLLRTYWGADEDGDEWKITLLGTPSSMR